MPCEALTNHNSVDGVLGVPIFLSSDEQPKSMKVKNNSQVKTYCPRYLISPEFFIKLELSFVLEVEKVFVTPEDNGRVLRVLTVINERDPAVQEKIYPVELSIMDEYPHLRFDFHILSRMNRKLSDVMARTGRLIFTR